jgi:SAM-dependent methyltransferase
VRLIGGRPRLARLAPRLLGLFGFQGNNDTRTVEYPWAFYAVEVRPGMTVVEIGGALSGFQFVLANAGAKVINVDPVDGAYGARLPLNESTIARLNRAFGTDVELRRCTLDEARLPSASVDVVYSISTIEHLPDQQLEVLTREVARILRPGGHAVLTIDLFLDVAPFAEATENRWGRNVDLAALIDASGLDLVSGVEPDLHGFPTFDPDDVVRRLPSLYVGAGYPVCAQALVLRKP